MASRFASISEKEILSMNEEAVPKNTKMWTKFGLTVFNGKLFNLLAKNQNTMPCLRQLLSTKITMKHLIFFQLGFNNKRNFTQPLRKWDRSNLTSACKSFICWQEDETEHFSIKNRSLRAIRAALNRHLRSPPLNKPFSVISPLFIQLVWYILKQSFTSVNNC